MTREEMLNALRREHLNFLMSVGGLGDELLSNEAVMEDWTVKDIMGHIAMWMQIANNFIMEYRATGAPTPLGFQDDGAVNAYNARGWETRRELPLTRVLEELNAAYRDLVASAEALNPEELNAPLPAPWEKQWTLERLIAVNSYEHEPEHIQQIAAWRATFEDEDEEEHEDE